MLWFAGPEAQCAFCNKAWLDFRGRGLDDEIESGRLEGIHEDDRQSYLDSYLAAFKARRFFQAEYRLLRLDGEYRWLLDQGSPVHANDGTFLGYIGAAVDISERTLFEERTVRLGRQAPHGAEAEDHERRFQEQLRQSQKMEVIGRLTGGVAHDFNNLLTIISGYSDLALDQLLDGDPTKDLVQEIRNAGQRAASLTRKLLAFSRKQTLESKILNVNAIISSSEKMLKPLLEEDIMFATVLAPDLDYVKADPSQIEQLFINLAVNAREAMPQGGKLTIETANVELDAAYCDSHSGVRPGHYVMLAVSDTGCGMDETIRSQIFEPFFTTKGQVQGTGLGLAMIANFVQQIQGHITVYSEPECGATFKIYLPRVEPPLSPALVERTSAPVAYGTETILLVEDDDAVRTLTRIILQSTGYEVLEASNGADARQVAERYANVIHLLVSDVVLPDLAGPQVAKQLISLRPDLKVLYVSGYTDEAIVRHGVLESNENFLQKPFMPNDLLRKIREVLDG